jgi:hypothetical protein
MNKQAKREQPATELRDRFFALSSGTASEEEKRRFRAQVDSIDSEPVLELDGLAVSHHPTRRFKGLRFVEADRIDATLRPLFARPSPQMPDLAAVFVDPEEFSYRTFENILPLDRFFDGLPLELELGKRKALGGSKQPVGYTFSLQADEQTKQALASLDSLGLYVCPQNPESRGGQRFIFHAAGLSEALTTAVRDALPKRWKKGFVHVNPVFRCNRFEPGDAKFRRHVDTPYYDAARKHVSRYTMLVYLTGGHGRPALQLGDDVTLDAIESLTCVVFRQDLEHEGSAYLEGRKVFLRTELIFEYTRMTHDPAIAQTFAKACYLSGESVFAPELARATHELYDRAAAAHWGKTRAVEPEPFLRKRFGELEFLTNGYDYWFGKSLSLPDCAAIAVLDTLNCKVGGQAFRKLCTTEVVNSPQVLSRAPKEPPFVALDLDSLFPPSEEVDEDICCPFHAYQIWDATRALETVGLYQRAQRFAKRRIQACAITMMGQEIFLDPDKFVIENGKIHVLADQALAPVNFAACWNDGSQPSNYLEVEVSVEAPHLLVPPILFVETEHGHHLMLDMFRNSWMVSYEPRAVPVPKLRNLGAEQYDSGEWESTPWLDAAARLSEVEDADEPWWTPEQDEVVRELYADGDD